jgi:inorganic pyrophosphatase
VDVPVEEYTAKIVAIVHRHNDVEDKLVAAPDGAIFTKEEIKKNIYFQEKYYNSEIEMRAEQIK